MPENADRLAPTAHRSQRLPLSRLAASLLSFNVYSDKKRLKKLDDMHNNPVQRGLVSSADQWPWSSFRFYYLDDSSVLSMDRLV